MTGRNEYVVYNAYRIMPQHVVTYFPVWYSHKHHMPRRQKKLGSIPTTSTTSTTSTSAAGPSTSSLHPTLPTLPPIVRQIGGCMFCYGNPASTCRCGLTMNNQCLYCNNTPRMCTCPTFKIYSEQHKGVEEIPYRCIPMSFKVVARMTSQACGQGIGAPSGQGIGTPSGQGITPSGQSIAPSGQGFGAPSGQGFGAPSGQGFAVPSGQGFGVPSGQGIGAPSGQGIGAPSGQGIGVPSGQFIGTPNYGHNCRQCTAHYSTTNCAAITAGSLWIQQSTSSRHTKQVTTAAIPAQPSASVSGTSSTIPTQPSASVSGNSSTMNTTPRRSPRIAEKMAKKNAKK